MIFGRQSTELDSEAKFCGLINNIRNLPEISSFLKHE